MFFIIDGKLSMRSGNMYGKAGGFMGGRDAGVGRK